MIIDQCDMPYLLLLNNLGDALLFFVVEIWSHFQQEGQSLFSCGGQLVSCCDHGRDEAFELSRTLKIAEPGGVRTSIWILINKLLLIQFHQYNTYLIYALTLTR